MKEKRGEGKEGENETDVCWFFRKKSAVWFQFRADERLEGDILVLFVEQEMLTFSSLCERG